MSEKFTKLYISLKFRLHGMGFYRAMVMLEKGREVHSGFRKDNITPEFQHQLEIAHYILTLKDVVELENALICALGHDFMEDYPEQFDARWIKSEFGENNLNTMQLLNKNLAADYPEYFDRLQNDLNGSIVKLADRVNNFQSMNRGKFSVEKQRKYADEVQRYFLPMAKYARKKFPAQMDAYYNVETMLKSQHELLQLFLGGD